MSQPKEPTLPCMHPGHSMPTGVKIGIKTWNGQVIPYDTKTGLPIGGVRDVKINQPMDGVSELTMTVLVYTECPNETWEKNDG